MIEGNDLNAENAIQEQLNKLKGLEQELMLKLDDLATKLPELYEGYANLVRQTFNAAFDIIGISSEKSEKIGVAVEVLARGIEAYGAYKAAKEHNERLEKYMRVKKEFAALNKSKILSLKRKIESTIISSEKLFTKFAETGYKLVGASDRNIIRQGNLLIRVLTLYRTNFFILTLSEFLESELGAWERGEQTSGEIQPDYFTVNSLIFQSLFGDKDSFSIVKEICEKKETLKGSEIMVLADSQLFLYSLKDELCEIDFTECSPSIKALIENNPSTHKYKEMTRDIKKHIKRNPTQGIWIACAVGAFFISITILSLYPEGISKWVFLILGLAATFRIGKKNAMKAKINHVLIGSEKAETWIAQTMQLCGYVETEEIDYEEKDTTMALIKGFFKI